MENYFDKFVADCHEIFAEAVDYAAPDFWDAILALLGQNGPSSPETGDNYGIFRDAALAALAWLERPEATRFARCLDAVAGNGRQGAEEALGKLKAIFEEARDIAEWAISYEKRERERNGKA